LDKRLQVAIDGSVGIAAREGEGGTSADKKNGGSSRSHDN
jgi:hypothetical protein